jgi:hypothetical protein
MSQSGQTGRQTHLSSDQIVGYIDQSLPEGMQREVEGHLSECQQCLREVLDVRRLLREHI